LDKCYKRKFSEKQLAAGLRRENQLKLLFTDEVRNEQIVDVGCGPTADARFLVEQNEVHGIDISDADSNKPER